jgi:hypothetical protein
MKHLLLIITVLLLFAVAGCSKEPEKTAKGWAVEAAYEEYKQEYTGYALVNVEYFDYDYLYFSGQPSNDDEIYTLFFKVAFENPNNQEYNETYYVAVVWEPKIKFFEALNGYNPYNCPFPESAIVDIDIEEVEE